VTARPEALAGFGAALYRLRAAREWSLRRAAGEAGVSVTTVMRAEQGRSVGLAQAVGLARPSARCSTRRRDGRECQHR